MLTMAKPPLPCSQKKILHFPTGAFKYIYPGIEEHILLWQLFMNYEKIYHCLTKFVVPLLPILGKSEKNKHLSLN